MTGVPCFRPGINRIENISLNGRLITRFLIGFRPVWELDNNPAVWIFFLGRFHNQFTAYFSKQRSAEIFPASVSFGLSALFACASCKEPIIDDKFIKMPCSIPYCLYQPFTHGLIGIAVSPAKPLLFRVNFTQVFAGRCKRTGYFDPLTQEEIFYHPQLIVRDHQAIPIWLQINLVAAGVLFEKGKLFGELLFRDPDHTLRRAVDYQFKIAVFSHPITLL